MSDVVGGPEETGFKLTFETKGSVSEFGMARGRELQRAASAQALVTSLPWTPRVAHRRAVPKGSAAWLGALSLEAERLEAGVEAGGGGWLTAALHWG